MKLFSIEFLISLMAVFMALSGCRRELRQNKNITYGSDSPVEIYENIDSFVYEGPLFLKQKSIPDLRRLAPLKKETTVYKDNPYVAGEKIELKTLEFDGLVLFGIAEGKKFNPVLVTVTSPKWKILGGLDVGSAASRVSATLGMPSRTMKGPVEEFAGETEVVKFSIKNDKISMIEFIYYID